MNLTLKDGIYHFAYYLVKDEHYDVVYMNVQHDEIWVRKTKQKKTQIIRLVNRQFNWKNHLKTDIAKVFQQVKMMRHQIKGQDISIFNIYTSYDEPVDSWETLKRTLILEDNHPLKMNVFYVTEANFENEEARIVKMLNVSHHFTESIQKDTKTNTEDDYTYYKNDLLNTFEAKQKKMKEKLKPKKPVGISLLISLMVISYIVYNLQINLLDFNVISNPSGKLFINSFKGIFYLPDLSHLLMSVIIIYIIGRLMERIFGSIRFLAIFLLSGILGNAFIMIVEPISTIDSSSAIFGLFGALLYYGVTYRKVIPYKIQRNYLLLLIISLGIAMALPEINLNQYIAGFIVGFFTAVAVGLPYIRRSNIQFAGIIVVTIFFLSIFFY